MTTDELNDKADEFLNGLLSEADWDAVIDRHAQELYSAYQVIGNMAEQRYPSLAEQFRRGMHRLLGRLVHHA